MTVKRVFLSVVGLLSVVLLSACSIGSPPEHEVHPIIENFYGAMQAGDASKASDYFSSKRPKEEWLMLLEYDLEKLGAVKSFEIKKTEVNTMLRGRLYTYEVSVQYGDGQASEVVAMFNQVDSDETAIISRAIAKEGYRPLGQ